MNEPRDLAEFLAQCGATVGGGAALGAAAGLLYGTARKDVALFSEWARRRGWAASDPVAYATRAAPFGAVGGVVALVLRWAGVH